MTKNKVIKINLEKGKVLYPLTKSWNYLLLKLGFVKNRKMG